jgi:hypothetical protein
MANSNPNTSGEKLALGISPDILFGMHTRVIMAWVFQSREWVLARPVDGDPSKVVVVDKYMPEGNYILLKVGDDVVNRPGFFQVPPPRRGKAKSNGE